MKLGCSADEGASDKPYRLKGDVGNHCDPLAFDLSLTVVQRDKSFRCAVRAH